MLYVKMSACLILEVVVLLTAHQALIVVFIFIHRIKNVSCLFLDLQKARLQKLQDEYLDELEIIKEEFDTERAIMVDQHNAEMNDIADILFAMEQNYQEREAEAKSEFQSMRDEIKNKVYKMWNTKIILLFYPHGDMF